MEVIVPQGFRHYWTHMATAVLRLLTLFALVLMPFGMAAAPAMGQPMPAHHATSSTGHCDEQPEQGQGPASKQMNCAAMCTAIPAADVPSPLLLLKPIAPRSIALAAPFVGVEPEIATPPPRTV